MSKLNRRQFNKVLMAGSASVPISFLAGGFAQADDLPMVDPEGATAKALQYVVKAEVEATNCSNCALYNDDGTEEKGSCTIFPAKLVPAEAWCAAYQPKPQ